MELDSRIVEGKRPLTCFDIEEAKKHIGEECYFTSKFESFENLSKVPHTTLHNIDESSTPFWCYGDDMELCYACFILPCEWVKQEPKYRPYTMSEFKSEFKINSVLTLRKRKEHEYVYQTVYLGNRHYDDTDSDENDIYLSQGTFSLRELFEIFEIVRNGDWEPFGVFDDCTKK